MELKDYEYYRTDNGVLYCGDCLEILPLLKCTECNGTGLLDAPTLRQDCDVSTCNDCKGTGNLKVDLILTDPPYGINLDTDWSDAKSNLDFAKAKGILGGNKYDRVINDDKDFDPSPFLNKFNYVKEQFWFGADYYAERLIDKNKGSWLVWDKRLDDSADKMYGSCFELIWSKEKHKRNIIRVKWAGVFGTEKQDIKKRLHPNQKPLALYYWILRKYSNKEGVVIDFYVGSGSCIVACEKLNRKWIGIEISEKYCAIARDRIKAENDQIKLFT